MRPTLIGIVVIKDTNADAVVQNPVKMVSKQAMWVVLVVVVVGVRGFSFKNENPPPNSHTLSLIHYLFVVFQERQAKKRETTHQTKLRKKKKRQLRRERRNNLNLPLYRIWMIKVVSQCVLDWLKITDEKWELRTEKKSLLLAQVGARESLINSEFLIINVSVAYWYFHFHLPKVKKV